MLLGRARGLPAALQGSVLLLTAFLSVQQGCWAADRHAGSAGVMPHVSCFCGGGNAVLQPCGQQVVLVNMGSNLDSHVGNMVPSHAFNAWHKVQKHTV